MKTNNFSFVQLLCTSILSVLVGVLSVVLVMSVKPHNEIAAATNNTSELVKVASFAHVHASITFELPTVAKVEVIQDATQPTTTAKVATNKVASVSSEGISEEDIQAVKDYCQKHMIRVEFADIEVKEPEVLIAAK